MKNKKTYFASDFHLGAPSFEGSLIREKKIVSWLSQIQEDAKTIYLVGDIFDFWFEYKTVVPRGFTRFMGKIAELTDYGIEVVFFTGNHDMWMFDYFEKELGVTVIRQKIEIKIDGKQFLIAHGDGLGKGDHGYKFTKVVFASKISKWLFARAHPNLGVGVANFISKKSRNKSKKSDEFLGEEKEWLINYSKEKLKEKHFDYFIFGHRHYPITLDLKTNSQYINLGEWITHFTYAVFDGENLELKSFF